MKRMSKRKCVVDNREILSAFFTNGCSADNKIFRNPFFCNTVLSHWEFVAQSLDQ